METRCCARAASGHAAAALPRSAMKLRRLMESARWAKAYQEQRCASQQNWALDDRLGPFSTIPAGLPFRALNPSETDCCKIDATGNLHIAAMRKLPVVLLCRSTLLLLKIVNRCHIRDSPSRQEGRYGQSSRNVRRVAMDAVDAQRRSAGDAFDKAVWSRHPDAGVKPAKSLQATVTKKARYAEESTE
jgi:hypothetical protein